MVFQTIRFLHQRLIEIAAGHRHHRHLHKRADVVTATAVAPEIIVWVDSNDATVSVETLSATTTILPSAASGSVFEKVVKASTTSDAASATSTSKTSASSEADDASSATASASEAAATGVSGLGITYDPYASDGSCKDLDTISSDFDTITGYNLVRIYGTDCDQVANLMSVASDKGFKLFAGVYDLSSLDDELSTITSAANGNWDLFHTISIGNELVNDGDATVDQVVSALNTARSTLTAAGYTGNIVTVDTFNAMIANPELCTASDYCAANCHAFFDGNVAAADAGSWVAEQAQRVSDAAGGKTTVITESGWPHAGQTNGAAVPSTENQAAALQSLKDNFSDNLFLFSALDDLWKSPGEYEVEQSWGFFN